MDNQGKRFEGHGVVHKESCKPQVVVADNFVNGLGHLFFLGVLAHGHDFKLEFVNVAKTNTHS